MNNSSYNVLIIDDDLEICKLVKDYLSKHSINVIICSNGDDIATIQSMIRDNRVDILLLDIMMPVRNGLELCREIRTFSDVIIIMISAMGEDTDRIVGLEVGADDYLPKPFNPRELLARIRSSMRRSITNTSIKNSTYHLIRFSGWVLDEIKRVLVSKDGIHIPLSPGEFLLLSIFLENPNKLLSRDYILNKTHNRDTGPFDRTIDVQIARIRKKIEFDSSDPKILTTIRGEGYILNAEVQYE